MKPDYIEFKKQRELGDVLSDTFGFLRKEFKPFFTTYFKIVGPFLLVMILAMIFYMYYAGSSFSLIFAGGTTELDNIAVIFVIALVYLFSLVAVYVVSQSTILHYIKSYASGKGTTDFDTIQKEVYASFWNFIGLGIMIGLSLFIGFIFCIIPGVYLYVPLMLAFSVLVFNKMGASDAYA
ncbi:MAG: hypothetical protein WBB27_13700, partial [Maribacter sp.]